MYYKMRKLICYCDILIQF